MYKALKAIQRSYQRAPMNAFVLSQRQQMQQGVSRPVPNRAVAMQHNIKQGSK